MITAALFRCATVLIRFNLNNSGFQGLHTSQALNSHKSFISNYDLNGIDPLKAVLYYYGIGKMIGRVYESEVD